MRNLHTSKPVRARGYAVVSNTNWSSNYPCQLALCPIGSRECSFRIILALLQGRPFLCLLSDIIWLQQFINTTIRGIYSVLFRFCKYNVKVTYIHLNCMLLQTRITWNKINAVQTGPESSKSIVFPRPLLSPSCWRHVDTASSSWDATWKNCNPIAHQFCYRCTPLTASWDLRFFVLHLC